MTRDELLALAERVEAATGPSAEERQTVIDAFNAVFPPDFMMSEEPCEQSDRVRRILHRTEFSKYINTSYYRASLDAAWMLVPEGCFATFDPHFMDDGGCVRFKGYCFAPDWKRWTPHGDWVDRVQSKLATTPALALTAAALRARAEEMK